MPDGAKPTTLATIKEHFESPDACYSALQQRYGGLPTSKDQPKYLFRGERSYFETTTPGTYRALLSDDPLAVKFARIDATAIFAEDYEDAGGDRDVGEALAQHYLTTSDGLDFSVSLGVALAFALGEDGKAIRHTAYIAVLDKPKADASRQFSLLDLRSVTTARRPILQHGFVAVHRAGNFFDLKDAATCEALGLVWYSFDVSPADITSNRHPDAPALGELYDIRDDDWAARMVAHLEELVDYPSGQWEDDGLQHLKDALAALRRRTGRSDTAAPPE